MVVVGAAVVGGVGTGTDVEVVGGGSARRAADELQAAKTIASTAAHLTAASMAVMSRVATSVWRATPELIIALDDRFGEPVDAYVNGSQVWLRGDGPGHVTIEWRLHPVAGYRRPADVGTYELFSATALALATDADPPAPLDQLWDGLEAFAAYEDDIEPAVLAAAATEAIGIPPDAAGLVDHDAIGDQWERSRGGISIVESLLQELEGR